jgi:hypothetical protein
MLRYYSGPTKRREIADKRMPILVMICLGMWEGIRLIKGIDEENETKEIAKKYPFSSLEIPK